MTQHPVDAFEDGGAEADTDQNVADQWQRQEVLLRYWRARLEGLSTVSLPGVDRQRTDRADARSEAVFLASPVLLSRLQALAQRQGTTLFTVLLAALQVLLMRHTGQHDIAVIAPLPDGLARGEVPGTCRHRRLVVLRTDLSGLTSFQDVLEHVCATVGSACEHADIALDEVLKHALPQAAADPGAPVPVSFSFTDRPLQSREISAAPATPEPEDAATSQADLRLDLSVDGGALEGRLSFRASDPDASTVTRLGAHYQQLLAAIAEDPTQEAACLPMLTDAERRQLLVDWNDTGMRFPSEPCLPQLIEAQVRRTPDSLAAVFADTSVTYRELNARANRIARQLRALGVEPDDLVAVCLPRGIEMIVAMLAIMKAGGAYLPLEPDYPPERTAFMLEDGRVGIVLTDSKTRDKAFPVAGPSSPRLICLDSDALELSAWAGDDLEPLATQADLAYVIYTSGSTGKPKGVMIEHRGLVSNITWQIGEFGFNADDCFLQRTTIIFDASIWELWTPLCVGATQVIADEMQLRDPAATLDLIRRHNITFASTVPSFLTAMLTDMERTRSRLPLRIFVVGGEPLSLQDAQRWASACDAELVNVYGPTECTIDATFVRYPPSVKCDVVSIGRPIANTRVYIVDAKMQPVPIGVTGEIYIASVGIARGYLNRPELTAERFVPDPFSHGEGKPLLYRTGDLGRYRPDGKIEFLGRTDEQVKIRGYRIELEEIQSQVAAAPGVHECVILCREDQPGNKRIVAYVIADDIDLAALGHDLERRLAHHMLPSAFVRMQAWPTLPNGKLNRNALPRPAGNRPELGCPYEAPASPLERHVCESFAMLLELDRVGRHDNFFDLGGHSLLAVRAVDEIERRSGHRFSAPTIFAKPTAAQLDAAAIAVPAADHAPAPQPSRHEPIAIIGIAGRFPGAESVEQLWLNLVAGIDSITTFTDQTLDPSLPESLRSASNYVKARGVITDADLFDAEFFGIPTREAEVMDPQHRIFLEAAWECIERAGYAPGREAGSIGVFAGVDTPTYMMHNVLPNHAVMENVGDLLVAIGNDKDFVATRVAYRLDLTGPAVAVNTACSTSLTAVAQAVDSLRAGRCAMALAGGATVHSPPNAGYLYEEGAMLSPDGHTRTFDAGASGTAFNDGVAVVLLKRLPDALRDRDQVLAIIRGVGINNDGGGKASFTAPSVDGQCAVISAAHEDAGVDAGSISYVEAHGTATPLGDPIEIEALTRAFRRHTSRIGFCRIGSVKSNVGHLVTAAGAAGLIKAALSLKHEKLPPTINFSRPNPHLELDQSPFVVNAELTPWPRSDVPRRAGISSFGVGGTNVHVVIEEAPLQEPSEPAAGMQLLRLSARTASALQKAALRLADHLDAHPQDNLADIAHTLRIGRTRFAERLVVVAEDHAGAARALRNLREPLRASRRLPPQKPDLVMLFPGQGSQYGGMGSGLHQSEPLFAAPFDEALEAFQPVLDFDLRQRMSQSGLDASSQTGTVQPAIFCLSYALARMWMSRGLQPAALIGHSVGEFVAAVIAGVMPLGQAAKLVATRARLMQALPPGSMLAVKLPCSELTAMLPAGLCIAAANAPAACVVSGPGDDIARFAALLDAREIANRLLQTSHAFHSSMMDAALDPFRQAVAGVTLQAPAIPIISSVTGTWLSPSQAVDPEYWASQMRLPVMFSAALQTALAQPANAFLEAGPRGGLCALVGQHATAGSKLALAVPTLGDSAGSEADTCLLAAGQLWTLGLEVAQAEGAGRRRMQLPTYPFERKRHWLQPVMSLPQVIPQPAVATDFPSTSSDFIPAQEDSALAPSAPLSGGRLPALLAQLNTLFEDVSGIEFSEADAQTPFVELGLDSLTLTQAAQRLKKTFAINITFRQLMETHRSTHSLAEHLDQTLPADPVQSAPAASQGPAQATALQAPQASPAQPAVLAAVPASAAPQLAVAAQPAFPFSTPAGLPAMSMALQPGNGNQSLLQAVIGQQMQLMSQQLLLIGGAQPAATQAWVEEAAPVQATSAQSPVQATSAQAAIPPVQSQPPASVQAAPSSQQPLVPEEAVAHRSYDVKKAFGAIARIHTTTDTSFTDRQKARLDSLIQRYVARTKSSKEFAARNRSHMADPRLVSGFRPQLKEMIYQIVVARSKGAYLWDIDGNKYVDALGGFGMCLFGWEPDFILDAVKAQLDLGYPIGPMSPLAADVTRLVCEMTGFDRAALVNTGSEAVMGAIRVARTATGRDKIVTFTGSYHGTFDEVLVRAGRNHRGIPAVPGIVPCMFGDIVVLDYGSPDSLKVIEAMADEIAAVVVEPVQSRMPEFQPKAFIKDLRELTERKAVCLIFDEVITGFRSSQGGAQEYYGVRADLATYGKVIGGGMPIGVIAGKREYMDALDGGGWEYGDDSMPTVGVTYLAGTFVRHPLAMAAAKASLCHMKEAGPQLQATLNRRVADMAASVNAYCREVGAPVEIRYFSSLWRISFTEEHPWQDLVFAMIRSRGVHIMDNFPNYMTTAHTLEDIDTIAQAIKDSVAEMQESEFLPRRVAVPAAVDASQPPVPNARLGKDETGKPAWFAPHPEKEGKYMKVTAA